MQVREPLRCDSVSGLDLQRLPQAGGFLGGIQAGLMDESAIEPQPGQQREPLGGFARELLGFIKALEIDQLENDRRPGVPQVGARRQRLPQECQQFLRLQNAARDLAEREHPIPEDGLPDQLLFDEAQRVLSFFETGGNLHQRSDGKLGVNRKPQCLLEIRACGVGMALAQKQVSAHAESVGMHRFELEGLVRFGHSFGKAALLR